MRNKLIELINDCRSMEGYGMDLVERQAEYLIANGVTIQQWIPVSEPPEENVEVLVFGDGCRDISEIYSQDCDGNPMWSYTGFGCDPEYWMYLPESPKENE